MQVAHWLQPFWIQKFSEIKNNIPNSINLVTTTVLIQKLETLRIKF